MKIRWPLVTTLIIGIQMVLGGVVVGKDAGFICPDWPLCHGVVLPKLSGLIVLELVHRAAALLVLVLVLGIAYVTVRKYRHETRLVRLATASVVSLFLQVIVGGLIVIWQLPGVTTTIDVANSMLLLGLYVLLTIEVYQMHHRQDSPKEELPRTLERAAWWNLFGIGFAILVGAVFRHTGASEALFGVNHYLASHGQTQMPSALMAQTSLMLHIMSGVIAFVTAAWFLIQAISVRKYTVNAWMLFLLVCTQMVLGMVSLDTKLAFWPVTVHWTNAGLLVALVTATLRMIQLSVHAVEEHAVETISRPDPGTA